MRVSRVPSLANWKRVTTTNWSACRRIAALKDKKDLPALLAELQLAAGGERLFFGFSAGQDFADATRQIAFAYAGGLGLPDRDYYLRPEQKYADYRAAYRKYVAALLAAAGERDAAAAAKRIEALETLPLAPLSQTIFTWSNAVLACQKVSATTATAESPT